MKETTSKKLSSLSRLNCQIEDFSSEITELIRESGKGIIYEKFVKRFLMYIPVDYRSKEKIKIFGEFTAQAYKFFQEKSASGKKIEVIKENFQDDPAITILVMTGNHSFIIDSLNSLMSRLALYPIYTFHPVINAVRDQSGRLKDILLAGRNDEQKSESEALIYIKVLGNFDQQIVKTIETQIGQLIDLIHHTQDAWQLLLNKITTITTYIASHRQLYESRKMPALQTLDFLNWLQKNNITFLGSVDFEIGQRAITNAKGVSEIWKDNIEEILTIIESSQNQYYANNLIVMGKINKISPVHINTLIDYILIKKLDEQGNYQSGTVIFGLYGTAIYFQSISNIPILREKINYVIDRSGFAVNGYNAKKIKNIIESLPRDILIQVDQDDLYCICIHMLSTMRSGRLKLFIQQDDIGSFLNIIVFMPRERLTPEVYNEISSYLKAKFSSEIIADNITVVAQNFSYLFITISVQSIKELNYDHREIEKYLTHISTNWSDGLLQELCQEMGVYTGGIKHQQVALTFPTEYKYYFQPKDTMEDLYYLEFATRKNRLISNLIKDENQQYFLKCYNPGESLILSKTLPLIENLGFLVLGERSFKIKESTYFKESWLYQFELKNNTAVNIDFSNLKTNLETALSKIIKGELISDILNKMILLAGFDWRKVKLLKTITRYLHQTDFIYSKDYVQKVLIEHYEYTRQLIDYFAARHDPQHYSIQESEVIASSMQTYLENVANSIEDKVLKNMFGITKAVIRTNFYQQQAGKNYIALKFDSSQVPDLPLPRPHAEIFVYSNDFEAIHLRGGKVARGGLRWSSRGEDYRTEVLGLMKAQMTKNTVIVPVGSKGCFYVKIPQEKTSYAKYLPKVIACYQDFLRGLLDVTDNLVDGQIVHPAKTIIHDEADPYLVVAADKGTATFSDFANDISDEYKFWLGDAFASGGSVGYDHKKMGVTAKGAWISVENHFAKLGMNIQAEAFSVVAIGDMSGDVFGNGMLLSKYIKLIAAFNHQHIFIDPKPDCLRSFAERKRLFTIPGTSWLDYQPELISKGGGVFERSAKFISISPEIQKLLELNENTTSPEQLIRYILKAKTDLMWNGGIGTYVKSSRENNVNIGDKANDILRINGNQLQAKLVAEGGNLGFSQLGRIEYALNGGLINTDFIDNSAGVDCSDHEVNIKITLNIAVAAGKISIDERNIILEKMTAAVEKLVLVDNYYQNIALNVALLSPSLTIESFSQLISEFENANLLNSEVEFLPDKAELSRRFIAKEKLTRPELAVLLSYSKMSLDKELLGAKFTEDPYFQKYLIDYFPAMMQKQFQSEISNHPLRKEIIRTVATNKVINQLGGVTVSLIKRETGCSADDLVKAYAIINKLFGLDELWSEINNLPVGLEIKIEMLDELIRVMRRGVKWFINNAKITVEIEKVINSYKLQLTDLRGTIDEVLIGATRYKFASRVKYFSEHGVGKNLAKSVAALSVLVSAFDIIYIAGVVNMSNKNIANLYFKAGDILNIDWLRMSCEAQLDQSFWNRLSVQSIKDDLYDKQRRIVSLIVLHNKNSKVKIPSLSKWLKQNKDTARIFTDFINDIKLQENCNLNMIILANKKLEIFLRKMEAS